MIYSSRLKKILEYCLKAEQRYVPMDELAKELKTSRRTIFRELQDVEEQLQPYGVQVHSKSGQGIRIEGEEEKKNALLEELHTQGIQYMNKEERRNLLIFELLHSDEIEKLIHYATMFQVSEATISNDLDAIENWFTAHDISISRKPGFGIELSGSEENRRKAMTAIIHETLQNSEDYRNIYYLDANLLLEQIFLQADKESIMKLLNQSILERILQVFHQYQHELSLDKYAQTSYIGLIIHLVIAIDRILKHEELSDNAHVLQMVKADSSYETACNMARLLEIEFDIEIPETEIAFIALHIKGAKISYVEHKNSENEEAKQLHELIQAMIATYDETIQYQLKQDEEFLQGLITHLQPTIIRLKNDLPIYNPLLSQLKQMYLDLFTQTKLACKELEKRYACKVSEDEVGFITMHVGASLERAATSPIQRIVRVGVVCASGIGVSALLAARIANAFPQGMEVVTLSMEHVAQKQFANCEMLISTFALQQNELPFLQVNTLLSEEDIEHIRIQLKTIRQHAKAHLVPIGIQNLQQELQFIKDASDAGLQIITNFTMLKLEAENNLEQVIEKYVSHLHVEKAKANAIIKALKKREEMGSIIMKDFHFALLHAQCEEIEECRVSFVYPQPPYTTFQHLEIDFVLVMLMPKTHTKAQQELMSRISRNLIEDDDFYAAIHAGKQTQINQQFGYMIHKYMETKTE